MKKSVAMRRYLERHIEANLPNAPVWSINSGDGRWQNVIVIPCYRESPALLANLAALSSEQSTLIILVLNRPESCSDKTINSELRAAIAQLKPATEDPTSAAGIYHISSSVELYCHDLEQLAGPTLDSQGVGLARKVGCDIALLWRCQGAIGGVWICSSDADATLPKDYFSRLEKSEKMCSAAVYPFVHLAGESEELTAATALYELRLHQYVLGLAYAKSPYAHHSLGSCIAVKGEHYAQVRGYPKRAAGEDFYLLNKLAKISPISSLRGECIALQSRASARVPFGTGPAAQQIIVDGGGDSTALFYHPQCFEALRAVLAVIGNLRMLPAEQLSLLLTEEGIAKPLCEAIEDALKGMELEAAIAHCRKQGQSSDQFQRQFHQWFDGFRTLKFIHAIRAKGWEMQSLTNLSVLTPCILPTIEDPTPDKSILRTRVLKQWQWTSPLLSHAREN